MFSGEIYQNNCSCVSEDLLVLQVLQRKSKHTNRNMFKFQMNFLQFRLYSRASRKLIEEAQEKVVKVAIIGLPNTGKSTLINTILNQRVSENSFGTMK